MELAWGSAVAGIFAFGEWVEGVGVGLGESRGGGVRGGGEEWMTPKYSRTKDPGLRSLAAKSPAWPQAGWAGSVIWVIFTKGQGPLGTFGGMESASWGLMRRLARCSAFRVGE